VNKKCNDDALNASRNRAYYLYWYIRSMHSWLKHSVFKNGRNVSRYKEVVIEKVIGGEGGQTFE